MNAKMNGAERKEVDLDKFVDRVIDVSVEYTSDKALIFLEYGQKWYGWLKGKACAKGLHELASIEMLYGSPKKPLMLGVFDKDGSHEVTDEYRSAVFHTSGYSSLCAAMEPFAKSGQTILDPCCGLGYTARFAVEHGLTFFGNELNLKRLEKTIERLS